MRIDAHCHTDCSDGCVSIEQRIRMIRDCGYLAGTITDHDYISTEQVNRALACGNDMLFIPGIELTTVHLGKTVHILGYFVNPDDSGLRKHIKELDEREYEIVRKMLRTIKSKWGFEILESDLDVDSPHSCHYLRLVKAVSRNCGYNFEKAQPVYYGSLAENNADWNSFFDCSVEKAIRLIHEAGGIAVLAHPGFEDDPIMGVLNFLDHDFSLFEQYKGWGLDGVECHCPSHSAVQSQRFGVWADKLGLLRTEGSDCHGADPALGPALMDKFHTENEHGVEDMIERLRIIQGNEAASKYSLDLGGNK